MWFAKTFSLVFFFFLPSIGRADLMVVQVLEDLENNTPLGKEQITLSVSGNRVRLDKGQSLSSIILADKKVTFSVMHEPRAYVKLSHDEMKVPNASEGEILDDAVFDTTNQLEQINGYRCRKVRVKEKDGTLMELWIAENALDMKSFLNEFKSFMEFGLAQASKQLEKHPELRGVPIRVVEYQGTKPIRRATIQRLDTAKISDSVFEIPAGYEEWKPSDPVSFPKEDKKEKPSKPSQK